MDRPRRTTRSSLASSNSGTPQTPSSSNPYKKPSYVSSSRSTPASSGETPSKSVNGTPASSRGRRGRGRPPGSGAGARPSTSGARSSGSGARGAGSSRGGHSKPECIAIRVDGRRSTGGSNASSGGGKRGSAGGRRSTYNSRQDFEYHYGSDFDSDQNDSEPDEELESEQESDADTASPVGRGDDNASDSDYSVNSSRISVSRLPSPPVPIWLDTEKGPDEPLNLPISSDDLLMSKEHVVKAVEIYEPLRRFQQLVRLTPFRFEDFCGALAVEDQSPLLSEIHIQLLKAILREEDANGTLFGSNEVKDSVAAVVYFVDHITWAESLRSYLESDSTWQEVYNAITSVEYPFCGPGIRIQVLSWLVDQFLATNAVREQLLGDGTILHEDHCRACNRLGEVICCEACPAVYHLQCISPPLKDPDNPPDDWKCSVCARHQISGVNDCTSEVERMGLLIRHERLGYDRHGRKYWFLVRRLLIESEDGSDVWYYSTRSQAEEVIKCLDEKNYEATLVANIKAIQEELFRQMDVTEEVTKTQNVQRRKTYLEVECGGDKDGGEQERMTRLKSTGLYKLGQEGLYRTYCNLFTVDPSAMNRIKQNEERDRKRHMSHKFSLTTASECKWGIKEFPSSRSTQINAMKSALTHMETILPTTLMHVNWPVLRKNWLSSVASASSAADFSRIMVMISSCIRNAVYNPIWAESSGHVRLIRSSLLEREERKKAEKRDKKDREDEEDRLKLLPQHVKYPIPMKHQVYKQKGEEYRIHGSWGWIWLSKFRQCKPRNCREHGLLAGPHKHVIQVKNETGKVKTMLIDPGVYSKLMAKRHLNANANPAAAGGTDALPNGDVSNETKPSDTSDNSEDKKEDDIPKVEAEPTADNETVKDETPDEKDVETDEVNAADAPNESDVKPEVTEPKVENMEVDTEEKEPIENGDVKMEEDVKHSVDEVKDKDNEIEAMEVDKPIESEVDEKSDEKPITEQNGDAGNPSESSDSNDSANPPEKEEGKSSAEGTPGDTGNSKDENSKEDSSGRKYKTELVNICSGLASAHRILYPKVARRCDYLDSLLQRRLTLLSLEEKQLKSQYGDDMVNKSKAGLAAFEEAEKKREEEKDEFPGEEVMDENLTLGGAYAYKCYSSDCVKAAQVFMETKGKNRERLYEKICYSPMCRLKFCLQETTRIKQERLREVEKEKYIKVYREINSKRVYSKDGTSQKILLIKLPENSWTVTVTNGIPAHKSHMHRAKKLVPQKYPQVSRFEYATSKQASILMLPPFELRKLARTAGRHFTPTGFFPNPKPGNWGWPYPCGRPVFRTSWQFKTNHAHTLAAAAMQLRILYASIKWDDILAKIPNTDGKNQIHTDTEIVTTEILNHRIIGRFMEKVQYLRKMMVVPIDAPKTIRAKSRDSAEIMPSRIGLRKRKRAESPDKTEPVVSEDWVDEEKLELWEIRYYGDRIDRKMDYRKSESNTPSTRTKSGIAIKQPEKFDPSPSPSAHSSTSAPGAEKKVESDTDNVNRTIDKVIRETKGEKIDPGKTVSPVKGAELMRTTLETELKMQRAVHMSKRDGHAKYGNNSVNNTVNAVAKVVPPVQQPTASQQLQQQKAGLPTNPRNQAVSVAVTTPTTKATTAGTDAQASGILNRKVFHSAVTINKGAGGTISVVKATPSTSQSPVTAPKAVITQSNGASNLATQILGPQKLSVQRLPDGRLQVKGLLPGQHCYQTADGKIHVTVSQSQLQQIQSGKLLPNQGTSVQFVTQQQQQQPIIIQSGASQPPVPAQVQSQSVPSTMASPVTSTIVAPTSTSVSMAQAQPTPVSSQPLINISNPAIKTVIANSPKPGVQPQQIIVHQGGQQLIIQGTSAQALLQQKNLQKLVQGASPGPGKQVNKGPIIVTTSGSLPTASNGNNQVTTQGRIVIQDGKALLINSGATPTQLSAEQRKLLGGSKVIQGSPSGTMIRPQVMQSGVTGQLGQPVQIIQTGGGQQVHLIGQNSQGQPVVIQQQMKEPMKEGPTITKVMSMSTMASPVSVASSQVVTSPKVSIGSSTVASPGVKQVLADGRTVLLTSQQISELTAGGRKVILNKQVTPTSPTVRPQQIVQAGTLMSPGQPTIQILQGPGGQQFLIQQPSMQQPQGQGQMQIIMPGGNQMGQPLLVKKFVKPVGNKNSPAGVGGGTGVMQIAGTVQNQLTQILGNNKTIYRLENNQLSAIQLPMSSATSPTSTTPTIKSVTSVASPAAAQQQQPQTTITRTPGLPISIVSPSKAKVQQKSGTVQIIASSSGDSNTTGMSPVTTPVVAQQVTVATTKSMSTPAVLRIGTGVTKLGGAPVVRAIAAPPSAALTSPRGPSPSVALVVSSPQKQGSILSGIESLSPTATINATPQKHADSPSGGSVANVLASSPVKILSMASPEMASMTGSASTILANTSTPPTSTVLTNQVPSVVMPTQSAPSSSPVTGSGILLGGSAPVAGPSRGLQPLQMAICQTPPNPTNRARTGPSKIVAQIYSTARGPKVVIQGVSPGSLSAAQLSQLHTQIQRQLASQMPTLPEPSGNEDDTSQSDNPNVSAPVCEPQPPTVPLTSSSRHNQPDPEPDASDNEQEPQEIQESESPPQSRQAQNGQEITTITPFSLDSANLSIPKPIEAPVTSSPTSSPSLQVAPTSHTSPSKPVVGTLDLVAAVSSVTEPAIVNNHVPPPILASPRQSQTPVVSQVSQYKVAEGGNGVEDGKPVVKKPHQRKSTPTIRNTNPDPTPIMSLPIPTHNNHNASNSISSVSIENNTMSISNEGVTHLTPEQHSLLVERRNALKDDLMEKKKAAAVQMKLEAQREIRELNNVTEPNGPVSKPDNHSLLDAPGRAKKRKSKELENVDSGNSVDSISPTHKQPKGSKRKRKLLCVCKTPYDKDQFYVGCDKCENWFHGECVGITEEMSKDMPEYICDACKDDDDKLYCLCRKPYNESQFYIQCDKCEEWFHGRCVGVIPGEADSIGDYSCPGCEPNSGINFANSKRLDTTDHMSIGRVVKDMFQHRSSIPFRKPVTKAQAPNYFSVIKEPMDLQTINMRVEERQYERLQDFIADVNKIFENCRYFNDPSSDTYRSSENLEKFFVQKIWALRQNFNTRLHQVIP